MRQNQIVGLRRCIEPVHKSRDHVGVFLGDEVVERMVGLFELVADRVCERSRTDELGTGTVVTTVLYSSSLVVIMTRHGTCGRAHVHSSSALCSKQILERQLEVRSDHRLRRG